MSNKISRGHLFIAFIVLALTGIIVWAVSALLTKSSWQASTTESTGQPQTGQ
jgi:hypothetical protein